MSDFRPGDNVVLKSGGPTMTVSVEELFEPTALILEEKAIPPAKEED